MALNIAMALQQYCAKVCVYIPRFVEALARIMLEESVTSSGRSVSIIRMELYDESERVNTSPCDCVVFLCKNDVCTNIQSKRIVLISNRFPRARSFKKIKVYHVEGNKYVLIMSGSLCLLVMERGLVRDLNLPSEVIEAYKALSEYFIEFGALKIRDAVNILCSALSIDKSRARSLLQELVKLRLAAVRSGYIELIVTTLPSD